MAYSVGSDCTTDLEQGVTTLNAISHPELASTSMLVRTPLHATRSTGSDTRGDVLSLPNASGVGAFLSVPSGVSSYASSSGASSHDGDSVESITYTPSESPEPRSTIAGPLNLESTASLASGPSFQEFQVPEINTFDFDEAPGTYTDSLFSSFDTFMELEYLPPVEDSYLQVDLTNTLSNGQPPGSRQSTLDFSPLPPQFLGNSPTLGNSPAPSPYSSCNELSIFGSEVWEFGLDSWSTQPMAPEINDISKPIETVADEMESATLSTTISNASENTFTGNVPVPDIKIRPCSSQRHASVPSGRGSTKTLHQKSGCNILKPDDEEEDEIKRVRTRRRLVKGNRGKNRVTKKRPIIDEKAKSETKLTRKVKACIRCRLYRIRCTPAENNHLGVCVTCLTVTPDIYILPCIRGLLTDIPLFRLGATENFLWSRRWLGSKLKEVTTWQSADVKWIQLTQDYGGTYINVPVKKFIPLPGDTLTYSWNSSNGPGELECAPYALADIQHCTKELRRHIEEAVDQHVQTLLKGKTGILSKTFSMILSILNRAEVFLLFRTHGIL
ncbi:hypothetical protein AUP68_03879 [Ilyonectria robusta]